jgi:hypothetical protein
MYISAIRCVRIILRKTNTLCGRCKKDKTYLIKSIIFSTKFCPFTQPKGQVDFLWKHESIICSLNTHPTDSLLILFDLSIPCAHCKINEHVSSFQIRKRRLSFQTLTCEFLDKKKNPSMWGIFLKSWIDHLSRTHISTKHDPRRKRKKIWKCSPIYILRSNPFGWDWTLSLVLGFFFRITLAVS